MSNDDTRLIAVHEDLRDLSRFAEAKRAQWAAEDAAMFDAIVAGEFPHYGDPS